MKSKSSEKYKEKIRWYYDSSQLLYSIFCYNSNSLGMHYGFWDKNTRSRHEAMLNENQAIIDLANITARDQVLDAGCGVGGTAIYVAQKTGAKVTGITLSRNQVNLAKKYALRQGVSHLTDFQVQDYAKTNFPGNSFDVIYGIESICYASPKMSFLKEAFRIIKPGGRIVIADGYCARKPEGRREEQMVEAIVRGFTLKNLVTHKEMSDFLLKSGFVNLKVFDKLESVKPSVRYFSLLAGFSFPLVKLLSLIPLPLFKAMDQNRLALSAGGKLLNNGIVAYYLHYAQKPW